MGLVGNAPNQVPTNGDLGPLAFRDENPAGAIVGATATQVLTNKTITSPVINSGTANGVAYLNSSKVLTSGSGLTFDGTKFGVVGSTGVSGAVASFTTIDNPSAGRDFLRFIRQGLGTVGSIEYSESNSLGISATAAALFRINGSEQMRLTSAGLGIGTSSPTQMVQVGETSKGLRNLLRVAGNYNFDGAYLGAAGSNGGGALELISHSSASNSSGWRVSHHVDTAPGCLVFSRAEAVGSFGALSYVEKLRIDDGGNLLVGTTVVNDTPSQGVQLNNIGSVGRVAIGHASGSVSGDLYVNFAYSGTAIGSITQNGTTAVAYNTSSDYRLKNITGPITNSGEYIDSLNPVEGTWKADGSTFVGLIAHEVQEVSRTQVATGVKDGEQMQAMDYSASELIANMLAELKSLRARVAALESR